MKAARFDFDPVLATAAETRPARPACRSALPGAQSVKHLIESLGIPHTEIGPLTANGVKIGQEYIVQDGDRLEVRPVAPVANLRTEPRFVLDGHLGRLASHLRMLGLDCLYNNAYEDEELVRISVEEGRILLTRDRLLLMHKVITQWISGAQPGLNAEQLYEVVQRYGLVNGSSRSRAA
jgi:uncharacterized protein